MIRFVMPLFVSFFLGLSYQSHAQQYYETRICHDCDYNEARQLASQLEPPLECFLGKNEEDFGPEQQVCYSKTNKVLIVNASQRVIFGFYNGHSNQGQPAHYLLNYVSDNANIPTQAEQLVGDILDFYEDFHSVAAELSGTQVSSNSHSLVGLSSLNNTATQPEECASSLEAKAVEEAFSSTNRSEIQVRAQRLLASKPSLAKHFSETRVTGTSFSFGRDGFSIGGSWVYYPKSLFIVNQFETDVPIETKLNQVAFRMQYINNRIELTLDDALTYFEGLALNILKQNGAHANELSFCLGEALDEAFKKLVTSPSGSLGGGSGSGSGSSSGASPGWGNIPVKQTGWGSGGQVQTCDHIYYDRHGKEMLRVEGPCP